MPAARDNGWEPEEGLESCYDCPECSYKRYSGTASRHGFKRHLVKEHGYTVAEARREALGSER